MEYIKEDGIIYKVTKRLVDLDGMKAQLAEEQAMKEPTDKELIADGKSAHPYYLRDTKGLEGEITKLEKVK